MWLRLPLEYCEKKQVTRQQESQPHAVSTTTFCKDRTFKILRKKIDVLCNRLDTPRPPTLQLQVGGRCSFPPPARGPLGAGPKKGGEQIKQGEHPPLKHTGLSGDGFLLNLLGELTQVSCSPSIPFKLPLKQN